MNNEWGVYYNGTQNNKSFVYAYNKQYLFLE